jgi:hypothetical protein
MSYVIEQERKRIPPSPSKLKQQQHRGRVQAIQEEELRLVSIFETQVLSHFLSVVLFPSLLSRKFSCLMLQIFYIFFLLRAQRYPPSPPPPATVLTL